MPEYSSTTITPADSVQVPMMNGSTPGNATLSSLKSYYLADAGSAGGLATLDSDGKLTSSQIPDTSDDVLVYTAYANFPSTGEEGKLYIDQTESLGYLWSDDDAAYSQVSTNVVQSITSGDTTHSPSSDVVYDALAEKVALPSTTPTQYNMAYFGSNGDLVDAGFTYLEALKSIVITDSTTTVADIATQLTTINNNGDHVFFDVSALGAGMYLCTIYTDTTNLIYKVFDLVSGRFTSGSYDNSTLLSMVLANADTVATQSQIDNLQTQINELGGSSLITDWDSLGDAILAGTSTNYVSAGDTIDVNWITSVTGTSSQGNTVTCSDYDTFVNELGKAEDGTYYFVYDGANWTYDSATVDLSDYALSVSGTVVTGEVLTITTVVDSVNYTFVGYDDFTPVDGNVPHNWCLEQTYAPSYKAYDTYESLFCIQAGKSVSAGSYYVPMDSYRSGATFNVCFTLAETLGGDTKIQMMSNGNSSGTLVDADGNSVSNVYYGTSFTPITYGTLTSVGTTFTPTFLSTTDATSQGYTLLTDLNTDVNDPVVVVGLGLDQTAFGNSTWPYSNLRQWLNDDTTGTFVPTHDNDVPMTYNLTTGFLWGIDPRVRSLIQTAEISWTAGRGATDTYTNGTTYTSNDDVFLLSMKEMSFSINTSEGNMTDLYGSYTNNTLTNGAVVARAKYNKAGGTLNGYRWSRSAITGYAYNIWYVTSSGLYSDSNAYRDRYIAPAFIIGKASS